MPSPWITRSTLVPIMIAGLDCFRSSVTKRFSDILTKSPSIKLETLKEHQGLKTTTDLINCVIWLSLIISLSFGLTLLKTAYKVFRFGWFSWLSLVVSLRRVEWDPWRLAIPNFIQAKVQFEFPFRDSCFQLPCKVQ